MKKYQVYKVQNLINNKVYIGITVKNYLTRWKGHWREVASRSNFVFHNALRKYGKDAFSIVLLETVDSAEELCLREKYWIAAYKSLNREFGYNMTEGGDGTFGKKHSEATKQKISDKAAGRKSPRALRATIEDIRTGEVIKYDNCMEATTAIGVSQGYFSFYKSRYGFTLGEPFLVKDFYKVTLTKEYVPKQKPSTWTPERKAEHAKMLQESVAKWRQENPGLESKIQRERPASIAARKQVEQWSKDGQTLIATFPSTRDAAEATNLKKCNIATCARGKAKCFPGGYLWKYSSEQS